MARILLIEDDDSLRTLLRMLLDQSGHTVIEAHDGQEGLELSPATAADLVITDMMMPKMNGLEVMQSLRVRQPPVKIIAMSAGGRPGEEHPLEKARSLGAARVLAKPFSCSTLLAAINEVLADEPAQVSGG